MLSLYVVQWGQLGISEAMGALIPLRFVVTVITTATALPANDNITYM